MQFHAILLLLILACHAALGNRADVQGPVYFKGASELADTAKSADRWKKSSTTGDKNMPLPLQKRLESLLHDARDCISVRPTNTRDEDYVTEPEALRHLCHILQNATVRSTEGVASACLSAASGKIFQNMEGASGLRELVQVSQNISEILFAIGAANLDGSASSSAPYAQFEETLALRSQLDEPCAPATWTAFGKRDVFALARNWEKIYDCEMVSALDTCPVRLLYLLDLIRWGCHLHMEITSEGSGQQTYRAITSIMRATDKLRPALNRSRSMPCCAGRLREVRKENNRTVRLSAVLSDQYGGVFFLPAFASSAAEVSVQNGESESVTAFAAANALPGSLLALFAKNSVLLTSASVICCGAFCVALWQCVRRRPASKKTRNIKNWKRGSDVGVSRPGQANSSGLKPVRGDVSPDNSVPTQRNVPSMTSEAENRIRREILIPKLCKNATFCKVCHQLSPDDVIHFAVVKCSRHCKLNYHRNCQRSEMLVKGRTCAGKGGKCDGVIEDAVIDRI